MELKTIIHHAKSGTALSEENKRHPCPLGNRARGLVSWSRYFGRHICLFEIYQAPNRHIEQTEAIVEIALLRFMTKKDARKKPPAPDLSEFHLYEALDPIPVPEAVESDAEAAWALWDHALTAQQQDAANRAAQPTDTAATIHPPRSPMGPSGPTDQGRNEPHPCL